jgi:hypothetical protein
MKYILVKDRPVYHIAKQRPPGWRWMSLCGQAYKEDMAELADIAPHDRRICTPCANKAAHVGGLAPGISPDYKRCSSCNTIQPSEQFPPYGLVCTRCRKVKQYARDTRRYRDDLAARERNKAKARQQARLRYGAKKRARSAPSTAA